MTREEAIKELKILKEDYWEDDGYGYATAECQEAITALNMAIEALKQEPRWIPVSERLPEINKDILVCDRDEDIYISHLTQYNNFFSKQGDEIRGVKAWMPLPEPYKEEENG